MRPVPVRSKVPALSGAGKLYIRIFSCADFTLSVNALHDMIILCDHPGHRIREYAAAYRGTGFVYINEERLMKKMFWFPVLFVLALVSHITPSPSV